MEEKGTGIDMDELPSERQLGTISGMQCHQLRHSAQATVAWLHIGDGDCRGRKAEEAAWRIWVCQPHSGMEASDVGWIAVGSRIRRAAELDVGRPSFPPRQLSWEAAAAAAEGPSQPRALAVFSPTPRLADSDRAEQSKPRRAPSHPSLSLHRQCQPDSAMLGSSALSPSPIPAALLHLHAQIMLASAHCCTVRPLLVGLHCSVIIFAKGKPS